jgi:methyl-accepting chemotaxis protein
LKTFLNLRLSARLGAAFGFLVLKAQDKTAKEIASSAVELARTAEQLDQLVRRFKVTA